MVCHRGELLERLLFPIRHCPGGEETLKVCRERALAIATEHRETIVALARIVYAERRLTDRALIEALQSVGLDPLPLRP